MWFFKVTEGTIYRDSFPMPGHAYSGAPGAINKPELEAEPGVGPIPRGEYSIGDLEDRQGLRYFMRLTPKPGTNTYGRDGFEIHGDSLEHPGCASHGCIIAPPLVRLTIGRSSDRDLTVL